MIRFCRPVWQALATLPFASPLQSWRVARGSVTATLKTRVAVLCGIVLLLAFSACSVGPTYYSPSPEDVGVPAKFISRDLSLSGPREDIATWWEQFSDPILTTLITRALADNLDIVQAAARLRQARESLKQSRAGLFPSLTASGNSGRTWNKAVPDTDSYSTKIDATWSLDLFGGLRRNVAASRASLEASGYTLANVQIAIAAEVASNYVDARSFALRVTVARDTLKTQDENLEIAQFRAQAGLVSALDVEQARAQRAQTAATVPTFVRSLSAAQYRLAVLTGQAAGAIDEVLAPSTPIPVSSTVPTVGVPADILRQRPDVRSAERNLAVATALIGVAQGDLYPLLTLSSKVDLTSTALRTLTDYMTGNLFLSLAQVLFDGGRRRSVVRERQAAAEEALAVYRSTVLQALEDIENAVVALNAAKARSRELTIQVDASNNAAILARSNYRAGLADFTTLLDAERTLLTARDSLVSAQDDEATAVIQLYLALGGGWAPEAHVIASK